MTPVKKTASLDLAELFDGWRVIPRVFLLSCFIWTVYLTDWLISWYTNLPQPERGIEATGFASVVQVGVLGFLKLVYSDYAKSGRDWNERPIVNTASSSTVSATTTTVQTP